MGSFIVLWGEPQLEESWSRVFFTTGPLGGSRRCTRPCGRVQDIMYTWVSAPLNAAFFNHLIRTQISHFTPSLSAPGAQGCSHSFYHQSWDGTAAGSTEVPQRTEITLFALKMLTKVIWSLNLFLEYHLLASHASIWGNTILPCSNRKFNHLTHQIMKKVTK